MGETGPLRPGRGLVIRLKAMLPLGLKQQIAPKERKRLAIGISWSHETDLPQPEWGDILGLSL